MKDLNAWLAACPLVAILRGVKPDEVVDVGGALFGSGIRIIEVPLNSPDPFASIALLSGRFADSALIGAGTVTEVAQVERIADAGGRLVVMPHSDRAIVEAAKARGLIALPGFATPTEAFAMIDAGADGLKLFPAEGNPPAVLRAMRAVLPKSVPVLPVGSITPDNMAAYRQAGAAGFGLGSALYRPGATPGDVGDAAKLFLTRWREIAAA
jgi:2-dehydro-3-deoxyphosphogalactonate aldolase